MAKLPESIESSRTDAFFINPEHLTLITSKDHALYDDRVNDPTDEALVKNIMFHGVLEPILIRKNGDLVEVIDGRCRVKATIEANKRLSAEGKEIIRIPAMLKFGQESDLYGILISANECRRDDTPLARADKARRLLNMGKTIAEVAIMFGVSYQAIQNWLDLESVCPELRKAVESGVLSATAAAEMASMSHDEQRKNLSLMAKDAGKITVERVKRIKEEGDISVKPKIKTRKEIQAKIAEQVKIAQGLKGSMLEQAEGFCEALRWVLGEEGED